MTTIKNTYTSTSGTVYELQEFDNSRLYSPSEQRIVKAGQQEYWAAVNRDKLKAQQVDEQAKKPKVLTEDERFNIAKVADDKRKAEQEAIEKRYKDEADAKAAFLKTSPDTVNICESNLHSFLLNFHHWSVRKYTFVDSTIEAIAPNYYAVTMLKAAK